MSYRLFISHIFRRISVHIRCSYLNILRLHTIRSPLLRRNPIDRLLHKRHRVVHAVLDAHVQHLQEDIDANERRSASGRRRNSERINTRLMTRMSGKPERRTRATRGECWNYSITFFSVFLILNSTNRNVLHGFYEIRVIGLLVVLTFLPPKEHNL